MMEMIDIATKAEPVTHMASLSEDNFEDKDEDKKEGEQVEHQINEPEASSEDLDGGKGLMLNEQLKILSARDRKLQQDIGASISFKDRMRAFNASSNSVGGATESSRARSSSVGSATESSRVRRVPEIKTEDENLNSEDKVQATLKNTDVGKDNLEDHEASTSSLNEMIPEFQTKNQVTCDNDTNTGYQQDTTEEEQLETTDSEGKSYDESATAEVEPLAQRASTSTEYVSEDKVNVETENEIDQVVEPEASSEDSDGGKGLMLSWDERLKILTARDRKPQQDIGATVSLIDRIRAFTAKSA